MLIKKIISNKSIKNNISNNIIFQQLYLIHILRGGNTEFTGNDTFLNHYISIDFVGSEEAIKVPSPRLIKTHLKFEFVPFNNKTKYIFVGKFSLM